MKEQRIKEAGETRTEGKVWEIIGRERGGKRRVEEGIEEEEWKNYFMRLLGGVERKVVGERRKKIGGARKVGDRKSNKKVEE